MAGRRPLPTAVKKLRGNPGKRPLPPAEPKPAIAGAGDCPVYLAGEARAEWTRLAPELLRLGLLTMVDTAALAGYCEAFGRWRLYERLSDEVGPELAIAKGYRNAALKERQQMKALASEFGFTPSSRARVKSTPPAEEDPFADFDGLKVVTGGRG